MSCVKTASPRKSNSLLVPKTAALLTCYTNKYWNTAFGIGDVGVTGLNRELIVESILNMKFKVLFKISIIFISLVALCKFEKYLRNALYEIYSNNLELC